MQYGTSIGFTQQFIFPFAAWFLVIVGYSRNFIIPVAVIVAIYPLGLLFLLVYSIVLTPRTRGGPGNYISLVRGARLGVISVALISLPAFVILSDFFGVPQIAYGFLAVAVGSLWLPATVAAKLYGYILLDGKESTQFLERAMRSPMNFEALSTFFLGLFLRKFTVVRNPGRIIGLLAMGALFIGGWALLGSSGGSFAALFGLFVGVLIPVSSGASLVRTLPAESKQILSQMLAKLAPVHAEQGRAN